MFNVLRMLVALNNDSQPLRAVCSSYPAEYDVAELFFSPQSIEARLGYYLNQQL